MFAGVIMGLAEWIIDDTCLVYGWFWNILYTSVALREICLATSN